MMSPGAAGIAHALARAVSFCPFVTFALHEGRFKPSPRIKFVSSGTKCRALFRLDPPHPPKLGYRGPKCTGKRVGGG